MDGDQEMEAEARSRIMTERGFEYALDMKQSAQDKSLKKLEAKTKVLCDFLEQEDDIKIVESCYNEWDLLYNDVCEAHEQLYQLLCTQDSDTAKKEHDAWEAQFVTFFNVKRKYQDWFISKTRSTQKDSNSELRLPHQDDDRRSQYSRHSNESRSSVESHLSIQRLQEEQRRVELIERQKALQQRRLLEKEKLELKLKEEQFQIDTEIKVSDAKTKILNELERSMFHDTNDITIDDKVRDSVNANPRKDRTFVPVSRELIKPRDTGVASIKVQSATNELETIESVTAFNIAKELNKPKSEISKFSGSPLDYTRFKRQFEARVCKNTDSYDERLNYLLQFTVGEANKIVSGYSNLPAEIGYQATFKEFEERYGDSDLIAQTYVKKVLDWPAIKADSPKSLDELAIFLQECQYAVENVQAAKVLEYSENLRHVVQKLPYHLHDRWRNVVYDKKQKGESLTFQNLVSFVRREAKKANDPIYGKGMINTKPATPKDKGAKPRKSLATVVTHNGKASSSAATKDSTPSTPANDPCAFCSGSHVLSNCTNITHNTLKDRFEFLKSKGLCFGCLRKGHRKPECRNKHACAVCKRPHPTILHVEPQTENRPSQGSIQGNAVHTGAGTALPVVPVRLKSQVSDKYVTTYAFLDTGSTATFCSSRILDLLGVEGKRTTINMATLGKEAIQETQEVRGLEISSLDGENTIELPTVFTQPSLLISKADIPSREDILKWPHLSDVAFERIESDVDLLVGVNVPKAMEPWEIVPSESGGPFAIKTIFGWVVNGPLDSLAEEATVNANFIRVSLEDQLRDHINRDFPERSIDDKFENSIEDKCFMESVHRSVYKKDGHYCIGLPFQSEEVSMPNNKPQARQRLALLEKRFGKDETFANAYKEFMDKLIDKGYAERVPPDNQQKKGQVWYLPHHGVFHPKKNKIRVVFDCAARYGGTSLNDQLLQGPNLANSLFGTLTRFRRESVAVMGDIESMFCQVNVSPNDRNFQKFLWWPGGDTSMEPVEYHMKVHLFGATSSPSCANYALQQAAESARGKFNEQAINTVLRNMYVDDCIKSVDSDDSAVSLVKDIQAILKDGGFKICKWVSNSRRVMKSVPAEERAAEVKDLDLDSDQLPIERTLGVCWDAESDAFNFTVEVKDHPHTRRGILSTVSSIYDPLGFLAPMILNAKSLLQELCQLKISWDEPIPEQYDKKWCKWLGEICELRNFEVGRCFKPQGFGTLSSSELHHFADASEKGYGIVSYLRMVNSQGHVHCSFVMGKSRVAPLKKVTIPRLELTAATVAARTDKMLKQELDMNIDKTTFWTDSMSVLRYIRNTTSRFHTFVANRLNVIHEGSEPAQWRYINTKCNPADIASRGMPVDLIQWKNGWIEAPPFLLLSEDKWPVTPEDVGGLKADDPETKNAVVGCVKAVQTNSSVRVSLADNKARQNCVDQIINHHSSWYKLKRSIAWILKIKDELRRRIDPKHETNDNSSNTVITASDIQNAENAIVSYVQRQTFTQEIQALEKNQSHVKRDSYIRKLDPILENGVLRVGGRLDKASMPAEHKHPAILPKGHHLTALVLRQVHEDLMHAGRNHMLSALRQRFWVVNAPSAIRSLLKKCVSCRKCKSRVGEQKMAALPEDRVTPDEPPFTRVGVDYFGPIEVKSKRSRVKRYGAIFTCLASRAVHLEVAYSLDTDSYINCLRRFISRRGQVQTMRSDNGTNFVGGQRELRDAINQWNAHKISYAMTQRNIDWKFNPPAGSHHGGVWERLIRSVRNIMNSTLNEQVLDDEGLQTVLCEIEATLNDRPISRVSDRFDDLEALTPNHLLLLKRKPNLPPGLFCKTDNYCRRRWRQVQYMANLFWQRWVSEYLPLLQERQKWHERRKNLKVGDVVLIVDNTAPRNSWPMGIIEETLPDRSGLVRQVKVKTATNKLVRPIDKLCVILEAE